MHAYIYTHTCRHYTYLDIMYTDLVQGPQELDREVAELRVEEEEGRRLPGPLHTHNTRTHTHTHTHT